ncbi:MAG: Verru_Chthon cassette protein C [Chthoniobacterales bacterium]
MKKSQGFTLVELLVSLAVLALILGILLSVTSSIQSTWKSTEAKTEQYREARVAFESINRSVRQALLNTYWDYDDPNNPTAYQRRSELRFISGPVADLTLTSPFPGSATYGHAIFFQSIFGKSGDHPTLDRLLSTRGYFTALTDGKEKLPNFIGSSAPDRWRMRLYEFREPADDLTLYLITSDNDEEIADDEKTVVDTRKDWFTIPVGDAANSHLLAENILALIIRPKERAAANVGSATRSQYEKEVRNIAPDYFYDSSGSLSGELGERQEAQLPPIVQVTLVAISEDSANRLTKAQLQSLGSSINSFFRNDSAGMESQLSLGSGSSLEKLLIEHSPPIDYRIFTSNIPISGSKWSETLTSSP